MLLKLHEDRIQFISNFHYNHLNLIVHGVPSKNQNPELCVSHYFNPNVDNEYHSKCKPGQKTLFGSEFGCWKLYTSTKKVSKLSIFTIELSYTWTGLLSFERTLSPLNVTVSPEVNFESLWPQNFAIKQILSRWTLVLTKFFVLASEYETYSIALGYCWLPKPKSREQAIK